MFPQHFIDLLKAEDQQVKDILRSSRRLKQLRESGNLRAEQPLINKTWMLIFEKPSLRTRVSFEQAVKELGGHSITVQGNEVGLGVRESVADVARVVNGMVHGIIARVFEHTKLEEFAANASIPVINALSDDSHPCQALADILTMQEEFGEDLAGRKLAFVGDGNNVARSLAVICPMLGIQFALATPKGYEMSQAEVDKINARFPDMPMQLTHDPIEAVTDADAIYADTWVSMGQEEEKEQRLKEFDVFQINSELMAKAKPTAIALHCLPAYRGIEITDEVMDGPQSRVFPQAHNRLHAQKGLLSEMASFQEEQK